ncbi:MAG: fumarate hydratase, partial [Victivallaceae bacterium]
MKSPLRIVSSELISDAVASLSKLAAANLPQDVLNSLKSYHTCERNPLAAEFLRQCIENAEIARRDNVPICQDTGFAVFFIELGNQVVIEGDTLQEAVDKGVARGYTEGYLRKSIVNDPVFNRKNTTNNTPSVIHLTQVKGDKIKIVLAPKGGGSENMSAIKMLKPSDGVQGIIDFVVDTVTKAGGNPCPPVVVGVGIGGTFEKCALLAKTALLRQIGSVNPDNQYAELEEDLLRRINQSNVGPQGLGGDCTALAVHV